MHVKGLGNIVDSAQLETLDLVFTLLLVGQENDGHIARARAAAQLADDLIAVDIRQADILDDEVGHHILAQCHRVVSPRGGQHDIALCLKVSA